VESTLVYFFAGLFFLLGIGGLFGSWSWRRRGKESLQWPTVPGDVILSKLTEETDSDGDTLYGADIRYRYRVGEKSYESNQVQWAGSFKTSGGGSARKQIAKYPAGARVKVYYDQGKPNVAVLEPANRGGAWMTMVMAIAFTVIGGAILFLTWTR
jgi:hypothetical protein